MPKQKKPEHRYTEFADMTLTFFIQQELGILNAHYYVGLGDFNTPNTLSQDQVRGMVNADYIDGLG